LPINKIVSASRTEIVVSGVLPERVAQSLLTKTAGSPPVVSMRYTVNNDETRIRFLPCRIVVNSGHQRKILIPGVVPGIDKFIEDSWVAERKRAKKANDDLKWVAVVPFVVRNDAGKPVAVELGFYIESEGGKRKKKPVATDSAKEEKTPKEEPRGCKRNNVKKTLDRAVEFVIDALDELVDRENLEITRILDEVSMRYAAALDNRLLDDLEASMTSVSSAG
jgi:hypothetical protein